MLSSTLKEQFEELGVLHAKIAARYAIIAENIGEKDAECAPNAPATPESIGESPTETVA